MLNIFNYYALKASIDLSKFKTTKLTDTSNIFFGCTNFENLILSNFKMNEENRVE